MRINPRRAALFSLFIVVALGVRLVYLFQAAESPVTTLVILDSAAYQDRAEEIVRGGLLPTEVFRMSPAYPYLLALVYWVSDGVNTNAARAFQALLGAIGCGLTFLLGARLLGERAGIIAGVLFLFCGPLVFTEGLLLAESSLAFVHLLFLIAVVSAMRKRSIGLALWAGLLLGLAALLRGNVLLYLVPIVLLSVIHIVHSKLQRKGSKASYTGGATSNTPGGAPHTGRHCPAGIPARVGLSVLLGAVLPVLVTTALNYHAEGDIVLLSSNAGFNFYIGNHDKASGTFDKIAGHDESRGYDTIRDLDGRDFARRITGKSLSPSEASMFWFKATIANARERWGQFTLKMLKKVLLFFSSSEMPQIYSFSAARDEAPILKLLPITLAMLTPLGLLGLGLLFRMGSVHRLLALLGASYIISIALFFIVGRYRICILPLFIIFSAAAIDWLLGLLRTREWRRLAVAVAVLAALACIPFLPLAPDIPSTIHKRFAQAPSLVD